MTPHLNPADTRRLIEPLAIVQGMMGLRAWLSEVQFFIAKLKQRSFQGMPLCVARRHLSLLVRPATHRTHFMCHTTPAKGSSGVPYSTLHGIDAASTLPRRVEAVQLSLRC